MYDNAKERHIASIEQKVKEEEELKSKEKMQIEKVKAQKAAKKISKKNLKN